MFKKIFTFTALAISLHAHSISNIEDSRPGLPKEGWSGHVELGFDGKTGNQTEEHYNAAAKIISRHDDNIYLGIFDRKYGTTSGVTDDDDSFLHGRWTHLLNTKWAVEGFVQWEENIFDNLKSRSLIGSNIRHIIAEGDKVFSLTLGLGGFIEREVLDLDTYEQESKLWRINSFAVYKHRINDQVGISATLYYQPQTTDFSDYRGYMTSALSVKLTETLDLKLQYDVNIDSQPAKNLDASPEIDNSKINTSYKTSLVYRF